MADEVKKTNGVKAGQLIQRYKTQLKAERIARKAAETEREQLKARPSAEELERKVADYQKADKERAYRKVFDEAATAAGINPKALDMAWKNAGIDQTAEAPDPAKIKTAVETFAGEHDYLKTPASSSVETTPPPPLAKGQGSERGTPAGGDVAGIFKVTAAQLNDQIWSHENQAKLEAAASENRLVVV